MIEKVRRDQARTKMRQIGALFLKAIFAGCVHASRYRVYISKSLVDRTRDDLTARTKPATFKLPAGIVLAGGLSAGKEGFEMGPGAQIEFPLLNWNNGKMAHAQAQMAQAAQQYHVVKRRLALAVQETQTNYLAAQHHRATAQLPHNIGSYQPGREN